MKKLALILALSMLVCVSCSKKSDQDAKENQEENISNVATEQVEVEQVTEKTDAEEKVAEDFVTSAPAEVSEEEFLNFDEYFEDALKNTESAPSSDVEKEKEEKAEEKVETPAPKKAVAYVTDGYVLPEGMEPIPEGVEILPPAAVKNLKADFNWKKNEIVLTWDDPDTVGFTHVEIKNNKNQSIGKVNRKKNKFSFKVADKGEHKFIVTSCNFKGEKGKSAGCSFKNPYLFKSFSAPTVANSGKGKKVQAEIKGINFDKYGITEDDFKIKCPSSSMVASRSSVKRIDSNTLEATITIPGDSGKIPVIVSCGDVEFTGTFNVLDYSGYSIGKVMYDNGEAVAVIAGYDSLGYPFGLGLKETDGQKWATEGTFGCDNLFTDVVCDPSVVGIRSAIEADFTGDIDGVDNWDAIVKADKKCLNGDGTVNVNYVKSSYPAFYYALNYGETAKLPEGSKEGWFIPSLPELCQIYQNREKLNVALSEAGGKKLRAEDFYWSSSQNNTYGYNACAVRFVNGSIYKYYNKSNSIYARCVKMYK